MRSLETLKGIKTLSKEQQSSVNGGNDWRDACAAAEASGSSILAAMFCPWSDDSDNDKP